MFTLEKVVPWGRSFKEYTGMFLLAEADMAGRILGCGDGPAGFNAEATRRGAKVISCDPLYAFSNAAIEARIAATDEQVMDQTWKIRRSSFGNPSHRSMSLARCAWPP